MSSSSGLVAEPLRAVGNFNWVYLVDWIVIGVLSLFFLFYFNRLLATILSYFIRLYTWRIFKVYLDIEALQISPLAGRIFFRGVRYHGDCETVYVHDGQITWRYWLPKTKHARIFQPKTHETKNEEYSSRSSSDTDQSKKTSNQKFDLGLDTGPPCRITVKVSGVEAFIYNRTPAYDYVIDIIQKREEAVEARKPPSHTTHDPEKVVTEVQHRTTAGSSSSEATDPRKLQAQSSSNVASDQPLSRLSTATESFREDPRTHNKKLKPPAILRLFPIHVECKKAAAVLGNDNTPSIMTAKIDAAHGEFDASQSGPLDVFKILMGFDVSKPYIQMKPNVDFKEPQLVEATEIKRQSAQGDVDAKATTSTHNAFSSLFKLPRWASESLDSVAINPGKTDANLGLPFTQLETHGQERWHGLARYLDDTQHNEHDEWNDIEYAKSSVIADLERVGFQFYWDIAGPVLQHSAGGDFENGDHCDINGSVPPEYGMQLIVHGGYVVYGPWADRNRLIFQQIFFPAQFADSVPCKVLVSGQSRMCTVFKLDLLVSEETTVRIPFREHSKDASWKGRAAALTRQTGTQEQRKKGKSRKNSTSRRNKSSGLKGTDVRPFAWFDIKIKAGTTIHYKQDMFPRRLGYANDLDVSVSGVEIFSSLNHALLWTSQNVGVKADLSYPLAWNGLRDWTFWLEINHLDCFLLRDHTFLLVDLIEDWSRGPLADFYTFVPFKYMLKVHFNDFKLYLNTNDANIINNSEDLDDNEFVILYGQKLDADLAIPLDRFRPAESPITFDVNSTDLGFELCMPPKNTLSDLLTQKNVATLQSVELHGSYSACSEVRPGLTDTMLMEIIGTGLEIQFYGFFGRQLAKLKENYFGETVHFRTLEEYQELVRRDFKGADKDQPVIEGNDLDVILDITARDANILLPAGLYDADEHVRLHVDTADVDLRVNNYFLELMVNSVPVELSYTARTMAAPPRGSSQYVGSGTQLFIDGVKVGGHRLFGLPPAEPAYVSHWDIDAGSITGECEPAFFEKLIGAAQSLALGLGDHENAVPLPHYAPVHDSVFVRFACPELNVWCPIDDLAFLLSIKAVSGNFNDLAGRLFSQRLNMSIPELLVGCFDATAASRRLDEDHSSQTLAHVKTAITMTMVQRNAQFEDDRALQQKHIKDNDTQRGFRAACLYHDSETSVQDRHRENGALSLPLPSLPTPIAMNDLPQIGSFRQVPEASTLQNPRSESGAQGHEAFSSQKFLSIPDGRAPHQHSRRLSDQGLPAPTIPLSSPFKIPHFKLDSLQPDLSEVPDLSKTSTRTALRDDAYGNLEFDDSLNEDTVHTTVMIKVDPGISAFCSTDAVRSIANLLQRMSPKDPTQVLDSLQFTAIMEVISTNSKKRGDNSITDISLDLPQIHACFANNFTLEKPDERSSDRYNVIATNLALAVRIKAVSGRNSDIDATALHTTLGRLQLYAEEGSYQSRGEGAACNSEINDILVWLNITDRVSVNASFNDLQAAFASKQVDYLASLIHRTTMLGDEFQTRFADIVIEQDLRLRYLVYKLTELGEDLPDPPFLTRPAYAMRSSAEHVRNSDSWKILSRLHHTLRRLSDESRTDLVSRCRNKDFSLPADAESLVLARLDAWRSWDALRVRDSFVIRIVYASTGDVEKMHDRSRLPTDVSVRATTIRVIIDPGDKETSFSVRELGLVLSISPPPPPSAMQLFQDYKEARSNIIQIKTAEIALRVDWSICDLAERVISLFERSAPQPHRIEAEPAATPEDVVATETFHIVFSSGSTSLGVVSININVDLEVNDFKASVTGSGWQHKEGVVTVNSAVTSKNMVLALNGHERKLTRLEVVSPRLWIAYEQTTDEESINDCIKVVGDSNEALLQTKEEIIGLIEIASLVIRDELAYLNRMINVHGHDSPLRTQTTPPKGRGIMKVDVALFLNIYTVELALLSDMVYSTTGRTIRVSVSPDAHTHGQYQIDYDLKTQTHRVFTNASKARYAESTLEMPSINGTLKLLLDQHTVDISAMVSMEKIALEGSAIYGIASILGSKPASEGFEAIRADAISVMEQIKDMFPPTNKPVEAAASRAVYFDIRGTLAGFAISADAPSVTDTNTSANLLFDIQSVRARASNRSEKGKEPLPFPELRIVIDEIAAELRQTEKDKLRLAGKLSLQVLLTCDVVQRSDSRYDRTIHLSVTGPGVDMGAATAPAIVDVLGHLQSRVRGLDMTKERQFLRRLRKKERDIPTITFHESTASSQASSHSSLDDDPLQLVSSFAFDLQAMRVSYVTEDPSFSQESRDAHDLVLSLEQIRLETRSQAEAKLNMTNLQLALKPTSDTSAARPSTSALMPEVIFNVQHKATKKERRFAFQAAGKALDLQLDPQFVLPASDLHRSINMSSRRLREALKELDMAPRVNAGGAGMVPKKLLGDRNLSFLVVEASFAGAIVTLRAPGKSIGDRRGTLGPLRSQRGRYGQFSTEEGASAILRAPGIALKVQYADPGDVDPQLNVEFKVNASSNELDPSIVPLILQVSDAVKKVAREDSEADEEPADKEADEKKSEAYFDPEQTLVKADPKAILGKTQLNVGIRICKQEFSLSCQPIAKVSASAKLEDIYITINNVDSKLKNDHFFAASANIKGLNATLQHVYSRSITFSFDMESIMLSVMNSKHISGTNGISAILKIAPTKTQLNAKQMQDMLLFREIWFPQEIRNAHRALAVSTSHEPQDYFMHRYQQVAASTAFSWNATFSIEELSFDLDLGQSIGKVSAKLSNLWANSTKSSKSRQNLCVGVDDLDISSSGRLSGFVDLDQVKIRTSIAWPGPDETNNCPLIQGSIGFDRLCVKIAFDYQAFAVADVTSFEFIMYNVRNPHKQGADRLVAILDGDKVNVYCTASSAALTLSLYQAIQRLIQEKKAAYEQSLNDTERYLRRKSTAYPPRMASTIAKAVSPGLEDHETSRAPISLHTDVVVTLRALDVGAFPSTLLDQQILRGEASDVQARFAVVLEAGKIHSGLGLTLGQLRVALAVAPHPSMPKTLGEITIDEVVSNAHSARGGVILRVPKVVAAMQTWQRPESNTIEYIFRSSFEGKIDVGWNYSRISFIRGMYATHTRTLAARLGKPLPEPAVKIKGAPEAPSDLDEQTIANTIANTDVPGQEAPSTSTTKPNAKPNKITAEVALPDSKYNYVALDPPIIETPQLRDMGEATPPLEWVGLHRDRLPNVTHQIVIVTLLEIAKEVEEAYVGVLGRA